MTKPLPAPIKAVHKAWGKRVRSMRLHGGALDGQVSEHAEYAVHELCHATLLGVFVQYGRCRKHDVSAYIEASCDAKDKWLADRNEIQTLAAEFLVLRELGIRVPFTTILDLGSRNVQLFHPLDQRHRLSRCIRRARNTPRVRKAAEDVVSFIRNGKGNVLTCNSQ
jgi:hypothetical protein